MSNFFKCLIFGTALAALSNKLYPQSDETAAHFAISDLAHFETSEKTAEPASYFQPTPFALPRSTYGRAASSSAGAPELPRSSPAARIAPTATLPISNLSVFQSGNTFAVKDLVIKSEGTTLSARDLGDLIKKSTTAPSVATQARTPIVNDPRVRGGRIGSLGASGSYWVPARIDLDTVLSKFDSQQVESTTVVPGPFTTLLGPGLRFVDIELVRSQRLGPAASPWSGSSALSYGSNGDQVFGQQTASISGRDWGGMVAYTYRTGGDYIAGNGASFSSSYDSQDILVSLGRDWEQHSFEFSLIRLDQNNVAFPGYVFDIDDLTTDGYEINHRWDDANFASVTTELWYNRTAFSGNAQNPAKQEFFPLLSTLGYTGFTDVDSTSLGYRQMLRLADGDSWALSLGHDLRFVEQELNEVSNSFTLGIPLPVSNRNSPIPESYSLNPGIFLEVEKSLSSSKAIKAGVRADYVEADITDTPDKLAAVGLDFFPASYSEVVGTTEYEQTFGLVSAFGVVTEQSGPITSALSVGYAERAPNSTELYAAQPFMLLLQNGLNNVTGDPLLRKEKLLQFDLSIEYSSQLAQVGFRSFQSWGFNYITFENTQTLTSASSIDASQVSLRYVNSDLVSIGGFEGFVTLWPDELLTPFGTVSYTRATDLSRNGTAATTNGAAGSASEKREGLVRGAFSGIFGENTEPLPGIYPLESRVGLRLSNPDSDCKWAIEFSGRIVDNQSRVARSLLESATPGFATWDVRGILAPLPGKDVTLSCGVENLTNRTYREHLDYRTVSGRSVLQPGANFYLGLTANY